MMDTFTRKVMIYNDNHSLWKSVIPPTGYGKFYGAGYVSTKLFDLDNKVEMIGYFNDGSVTKIAIFNELGSVIKDFTNPGSYVVLNMDNVSKLVLYGDGYNYQVWSLPGKYTSGILPISGGGTESTSMIYPNPFDNAATIQYDLPQGTSQAQLSIYNNVGQAVRTYTVTNQFNDLTIQKNELTPGIYTYQLSAPGLNTTQQFVIR